ncbi:MAG: sugar transferase [Pseudomonadota bacterium]
MIAAFLVMPIVLILAVVCPIMLLCQGRPILFVSERMRTPTEPFHLYKLRTMSPGAVEGVLGGNGEARVTPLGRWLRALRIDELPQIFNILRGDMTFIGPRPPLRQYVSDYPEVYGSILMEPPGVTGLATVMLHQREKRILSRCNSEVETDSAYRERCIRPKARLDRFYRSHRCIVLDIKILFWTFSRLASRPTKRKRDAQRHRFSR